MIDIKVGQVFKVQKNFSVMVAVGRDPFDDMEIVYKQGSDFTITDIDLFEYETKYSIAEIVNQDGITHPFSFGYLNKLVNHGFIATDDEPKDNGDRQFCFWCGKSNIQVSKRIYFCKECGK